MKQRIDELDSIKTIGIILMVWGHCIATSMIHKSFFFNFMYLFHMPIFIISSGFLFMNDSNKREKITPFILNKIRHLFVPFVLINLLFLFTNNLQIVSIDGEVALPNEYIKTQPVLSFIEMIRFIPKIFMGSNTYLGGATWFLFYLFISIIVYYFLTLFLSRIIRLTGNCVYLFKGIILLLLYLLCYIADRNNFSFLGHELYLIKRVSLFLILLFLGEILRQDKVFYVLIKSTSKKLIVILLSLIILLVFARFGSVNIYSYRITDPVFFIISSILGWVLTFTISSFLCHSGVIKRITRYIGSKTIYIVGFHLMAFRILTWLVVSLGKMDDSFYMAYPVLPQTHKSFLIVPYLLFGILIPLAIERLWFYVKKIITNNKAKGDNN